MKNILHISDIHASNHPTKGMNEYRLDQLFSKLIDDISSFPIVIDTVFITGDIAFSGDSEEYAIFYKVMKKYLVEVLNISDSSIFCCPGNHDLQRAGWGISDKMAAKALLSYPEEDIKSYLIMSLAQLIAQAGKA
jgi:3',5'-cyclic AMP phosphodiesterase CpdA